MHLVEAWSKSKQHVERLEEQLSQQARTHRQAVLRFEEARSSWEAERHRYTLQLERLGDNVASLPATAITSEPNLAPVLKGILKNPAATRIIEPTVYEFLKETRKEDKENEMRDVEKPMIVAEVTTSSTVGTTKAEILRTSRSAQMLDRIMKPESGLSVIRQNRAIDALKRVKPSRFVYRKANSQSADLDLRSSLCLQDAKRASSTLALVTASDTKPGDTRGLRDESLAVSATASSADSSSTETLSIAIRSRANANYSQKDTDYGDERRSSGPRSSEPGSCGSRGVTTMPIAPAIKIDFRPN